MEENRCTMMQGVLLTNTACSSLCGTELLVILSAGKQSITDHRADITKIGCVHKHNLRSFSKEAEHVTRVHHVLPWVVVLTTVRLWESEPTSYLQGTSGTGHRARPATSPSVDIPPITSHWALHPLAFRADQRTCFSGSLCKTYHMYFTEWLICVNGWCPWQSRQQCSALRFACSRTRER